MPFFKNGNSGQLMGGRADGSRICRQNAFQGQGARGRGFVSSGNGPDGRRAACRVNYQTSQDNMLRARARSAYRLNRRNQERDHKIDSLLSKLDALLTTKQDG